MIWISLQEKDVLKEVVKFLNYKYGDIVQLEIEDSYYNMKEKIVPVMEIVEIAKSYERSRS